MGHGRAGQKSTSITKQMLYLCGGETSGNLLRGGPSVGTEDRIIWPTSIPE